MRSLLCLFSRLNRPGDLSRSSCGFPSRPFTIFVTLLGTFSNGYHNIQGTDVRFIGLKVLHLALLENWNNVHQLPVSWDLSRFPKLLKSYQERFCDDISQLFEDSEMNPIRPYRPVGIQLEQQISHSFRVDWELIILTVMILQLRALRLPWCIIHVEDRGKESVKQLCLVSVPVCEITILIQ
ncbi:hypothetical protein WISP_28397 [Willisornis vidua]|uniref:Uncharacterized protein n=1 Tax=Willisornis vidua TaxID=1566151 RepID=A0ABQ9DQD9_9PASS|nr:hypothetical protein WISP_28397 [Willisornis vidua]